MTKLDNINKLIINLFKKIFGEPSGNYGHDVILREYVGLPRWFPINACIQHGGYLGENPDLKKKTPLYLVWNKRIANQSGNQINARVEILGSPFVIYRRKKGIEISPAAKGTVVFPAHSSHSVIQQFDVLKYCEELSRLPNLFKPLTICLHYIDVDTLGPLFEKYGYSVVTAGKSRQGGTGFVDSFYKILSQHRYSTSNDIGSYTFYSVEMGVPFFVYGPESVAVLRHNNNQYNQSDLLEKVREMFREFKTEISDEQYKFVLDEVGINDAVTPKELRSILVKRALLMELPKYPGRFVKAIADRLVYIKQD